MPVGQHLDLLAEPEVLLRLGAGLVAGGVIGLNRSRGRKGVGIRTMSLVGLGTAAITATFGDAAGADAQSRVVQGVLGGIGFLGAGVILREGLERPRGVTTAASIWLAAVLGCSAGMGAWAVTLTGTGIALALLIAGQPLERLFGGGHPDEED